MFWSQQGCPAGQVTCRVLQWFDGGPARCNWKWNFPDWISQIRNDVPFLTIFRSFYELPNKQQGLLGAVNFWPASTLLSPGPGKRLYSPLSWLSLINDLGQSLHNKVKQTWRGYWKFPVHVAGSNFEPYRAIVGHGRCHAAELAVASTWPQLSARRLLPARARPRLRPPSAVSRQAPWAAGRVSCKEIKSSLWNGLRGPAAGW